jgi:predicted nucleotidyltransferase
MSAAVAHDVAQEFAAALAERLGEELVRVALFGSRARGEAQRPGGRCFRTRPPGPI